MFLAIIFIVIGLLLLLNVMGIIMGNFWGLFLAIVFLAMGIKMLIKQGKCPICTGYFWDRKMNQGDSCCDGEECECGHEQK